MTTNTQCKQRLTLET